MYFVYVLRCSDNSLYTGFATDVKRRLNEHLSDKKKGAKYTRLHIPIAVEAVWEAENRSSALKLEAFIKKLSKTQKEELIKNPEQISTKYEQKLNDNVYEAVDFEAL